METEETSTEASVDADTGLKTLVVNYIGDTLNGPEDITVDMAVQVFAAEFPEFLFAVAEENFIRGYRQAFIDTETGMALAQAEAQENEQS